MAVTLKYPMHIPIEYTKWIIFMQNRVIISYFINFLIWKIQNHSRVKWDIHFLFKECNRHSYEMKRFRVPHFTPQDFLNSFGFWGIPFKSFEFTFYTFEFLWILLILFKILLTSLYALCFTEFFWNLLRSWIHVYSKLRVVSYFNCLGNYEKRCLVSLLDLFIYLFVNSFEFCWNF